MISAIFRSLIASLSFSASAIAAENLELISPFPARAAAHFSVVFPIEKGKVVELLGGEQRILIAKTNLRIDPNCTSSPAKTVMEGDAPVIIICSRSFRYYFEFIEWGAFLSLYQLGHSSSAPQDYRRLLRKEWHYLAEKYEADKTRAVKALPQLVLCGPDTRLYLEIHDEPLQNCELDGTVYWRAREWMFGQDGLFSEKVARFLIQDTPQNEQDWINSVLRRYQNGFLRWAYLVIILHELSHVINGDLSSMPPENFEERETKADERAMAFVRAGYREEELVAGLALLYAEVFFELLHENSVVAPVDKIRVEATGSRILESARKIIESLSAERKDANPLLSSPMLSAPERSLLILPSEVQSGPNPLLVNPMLLENIETGLSILRGESIAAPPPSPPR
ncbi:hypothetical protein PQR71_18115 [Paraburkholderia fungorum]|uniref:hypothetical protein n=1 Tax=Paraburkholderia fungorum TaxID=134537 RepID=UPI0038BC2166